MMMSDRRLQINQLIHENGEGSSTRSNLQSTTPQTNGTRTNGLAPPLPEVWRFDENGRTYYAYRGDCVYPIPCDDEEGNRLDMLHTVITDVALYDKLFIADVNLNVSHRPQVLDVGYGTGIWLYEMAIRYPNLDVIGIDLYNNQPPRDDAIPNATFRTPVDFTQPNWGVREGTFDLVRMSQLGGCVPDWPQLYATVLRHLRPETGWLEHVEVDWMPRYEGMSGLPPSLAPLQQWYECMVEASTRLRGSIAYREDTGDLLLRAGYRDINRKTIQIPLGSRRTDSRDSKLRRWFLSIMCGNSPRLEETEYSLEALCMSLFTRQLGWRREHVTDICNRVRDAYFTNVGPLYHNIHIWTARKPRS